MLLGVVFLLTGCAAKPVRPKLPPPEVAAPPTTPAANRLREAIGYYLSADYRYGGASATALDCSGFVMKTYERAGIKIPRTTEQQFQSGKAVSPAQLAYGDLLFFNKYCQSKYSYATASILSGSFPTDEKPSHVGIYLGNNRFIHASASKGGVTISNLKEDCWQRSLIGVRRYLPK
ncbi:MAG: C40 family peptidase [Desulfobacca sp.]|uniref:C40 family peptidase n=1 Tax=Desulfobacca sp. TaxID=2067990 RepID=UPI00404A14BA